LKNFFQKQTLHKKGSVKLVPDYHLHSQFSKDSSALLEDYCRLALEFGIPEIAVTEHFTLYSFDKNFAGFDYANFIQEVERCRLRFKGQVAVKAGVEIDYHPCFEQKIKETIKNWDKLDVIIGSVHYIEGKSALKSKIEGKEEAEDFISNYFQIMEQMIQSGICDIIGHFDVFRRSLNKDFPLKSYLEKSEKILQQAAHHNLALELNTSGFKHGICDIFPNIEIVKMFKKYGGKYITIGSDAHHPEEFAVKQDEAIIAAKTAGFNHITCFEKRRPYLISLNLNNTQNHIKQASPFHRGLYFPMF